MVTKLALAALAAPVLALALAREDTPEPSSERPDPPTILQTLREVTWEEFEAAAL